MAQSDPQDTGIIAGINVTPLVDIVLVLLIVFLVTAQIIVAPSVTLDLPRAARGEDIQVVLSVVMPPEGPTLVDGKPMASFAQLQDEATRALVAHPALRVVIQADGAVPHRNVVAVMDALKTAGIERLAFAVSPKAP